MDAEGHRMGADNEDRIDRKVAKPTIDKAQANNNEIRSATWTVGEVAMYLRVGEGVVRRLIRQRHLRAAKIGGRWRIWPEDIAEYLSKQFERF
jgi:excisionase family DNA binding protein